MFKACYVTFFFASLTAKELVDKIEVIVRSSVVLSSDIRNKQAKGTNFLLSPFPATDASPPYDQALQDEVNLKIIEEKAKELELKVDDIELDAEITQYVTGRGLDMDRLKSLLSSQGQSFEEYRRDFRTQLLLSKFQGRVIYPRVKITDRDLELYYLEKTRGAGSVQQKLKVKRIVLSGVDRESKAEDIQKKIKEGISIDEIGRLSSSTVDELVINLGDLGDEFRKSLSTLKENEMSSLVRTKSAIYVFQVLERMMIRTSDFENTKDALLGELRNIELPKQLHLWLAEQRMDIKPLFLSNK